MKVSKLFSALSVILFVITNALCMLKNIKDTYQILNDDYKHLSICNGAIAWETGFIRRLYDFGQVFYTTTKDKNDLDVIDKYVNPELTHKTVRLIHVLFYRVPGSTGITDIGVTQKLNLKKTSEIAKKCAEILASIEQIRTLDRKFQDAVVLFENELTENKDQSKTKNTRSLLVSYVNQPWQVQVGTKINRILDQNSKSKELFENVKKTAENLSQELAKSEGNFKELIDPIALKKADMREVVLGSLRECNPKNADIIYIPHTTELVILAFVYKSCSQDRSALYDFYIRINDLLGQKILKNKLEEQWIGESFSPINKNQAFDTVEKIVDEDETLREKNIKNRYEELMYALSQVKSFPVLASYSLSLFVFPNQIQVFYPDCMDNSMRNFINILAYDNETNTFSIAKLKKALNKPDTHQIDSKLETYLNKFSLPGNISSPDAHNLWTDVISNRPFALYKQATAKQDIGDAKGFMNIPLKKIPQTLQQDVQNGLYIPVNKDSYGYETRACLYNVVIILNQLLNLGLFTDEIDCALQITQSNFLDTYLPKFKEALDAGELSVSSVLGEHYSGFDALDFGDMLYTKIQFPEISLEFRTKKGHGELVLGNALQTTRELMLKSHLEECSSMSDELIQLLFLYYYNESNFGNSSFLKTDKKMIYSLLFVLPLENTDLCDTFINSISPVFISLESIVQKSVINLLTKVINLQADTTQRYRLLLALINNIILEIKDDTYLAAHLEEYLNAAETIMFDPYGYPDQAYSFFELLIKKYDKRICPVILKLAQKGQALDQFLVRKRVPALYKILVSSNYEPAYDLALKSIKHEFYLPLYEVLFQRNIGFSQAIRTATEAMETFEDIDNGLNLFALLFRYKQGFEEADGVAHKIIFSRYTLSEMVQGALKLYKLLVLSNKYLDQARLAADDCLARNNEKIAKAAYEIYAVFAHDGLYLENVKNLALSLANQEDITLKKRAISLLSKLVKHKVYFAQASKVAAELASSDDDFDYGVDICNIFVTLVENNYEPCYEEAKKVADHYYAPDLRRLVEQKQGITQVNDD